MYDRSPLRRLASAGHYPDGLLGVCQTLNDSTQQLFHASSKVRASGSLPHASLQTSGSDGSWIIRIVSGGIDTAHECLRRGLDYVRPAILRVLYKIHITFVGR